MASVLGNGIKFFAAGVPLSAEGVELDGLDHLLDKLGAVALVLDFNMADEAEEESTIKLDILVEKEEGEFEWNTLTSDEAPTSTLASVSSLLDRFKKDD